MEITRRIINNSLANKISVNKEDVIIVGDSLADLFCAKQIGATFIGTLTGLKGQEARKELEHHEADYIVDRIGLIKNILL